MTEYHTIDFPCPAVSIILRNRGAVLLVRQQRFIVAREVWALPSGGVEDGEDPAAAATRELLEETGYRAGTLEHLLSYYPSYGVSNQVFHCFVADEPERVGVPDADEVQHAAWFNEAELRDRMRTGDIPDGFSLTPLLYLASGLAPQTTTERDRCQRIQLDANNGERA